MSELNLNFLHSNRHEPTKSEITEIHGLALSIEAIVKALDGYAGYDDSDLSNVCMGVCTALELLIDPIIEYMGNYAGDLPTPEKGEEKQQ